jgi:hypothetical protein
MRKELRNGAEGYPVHALRPGYESGERDCTILVGWSSAQARASFMASWGSYPRARIERRWAGKGLATVVALGRLWRVAGRSPELRVSSGKLGASRRRQRGRWPCMRVGFIATRVHGTSMGTGAAEGACGRALSCSQVSAHVEHMVVYFCQCSTACLVALACRSQQKSHVRSLLCTKSYLFHVSSKQRYGRR